MKLRNKTVPGKKKQFRLVKKIALIAIAIIAVGVGLITGYIQFGIATVACMRPPVAASKFAASYSYELPGEPFYGPNPFREYYCTEQAAKDAGFRHSALTPAGLQEQQAEIDQLDGVAANKSNFATYSPTYVPARFTKGGMLLLHIHGEIQAIQGLKTGSSDVVRLLQAQQTPISMHYWLCYGTGSACQVIGSDSQGRQVYKFTKNGIKTTYWGVLLDKTFIQIEAEDKANMTDQEAIQILGSLAPGLDTSQLK